MAKNIFVVRCDSSIFEESFSKKKNSEVINHLDIKQRLTNNDIFKNPPSSDVVDFHIMKKMNNFRKCKRTEFLFLYKESLDMNFVKAIKEFFNDCDYLVKYHLLTEKEIRDKSIKEEFNTVQIMNSF